MELQNKKKWAAAAGAVLACILAAAGLRGMSGAPGQGGESAAQREVREAAQGAEGSQGGQDAVQGAEGSGGQSGPDAIRGVIEEGKISQEELQMVSQLYQVLEQGNLEEGAKILVEQEELFARLFYETLGGAKALFDGSGFQEDIEGNGMVFVSSAAVFKGSFQAGKPQGNCLALQAFQLEKPRYDYALGLWNQGRMEGEGRVGYCYYQEAPDGETEAVDRQGNFQADRMDGMVNYTTFSQAEGQTTWEIQVTEGMISMDERWTYDGQMDDYHLPSKQNPGKVYAVSSEEIQEALWVNLLTW